VKLDVDWKSLGIQPMSRDQIANSKLRLQMFDKRDQKKKELQEIRNSLESYIFEQKDLLSDSSEFLMEITTEQQRADFLEKLQKASEWLEESLNEADTEDFRKQLRELKAVGDSIQSRITEMEARPAAIIRFLQDLVMLRETFDNITKIYNVTDEEQTAFTKRLDAAERWFNQKSAEQETLKPYETPAFTSTQISGRLADATSELVKFFRRPKRKISVEFDTNSTKTNDPEEILKEEANNI